MQPYKMPVPKGSVQRYTSEGIPYSEESDEYTASQMQAAYDAGRLSVLEEVLAALKKLPYNAYRGDCTDAIRNLSSNAEITGLPGYRDGTN